MYPNKPEISGGEEGHCLNNYLSPDFGGSRAKLKH